jgi:hypothetical protein
MLCRQSPELTSLLESSFLPALLPYMGRMRSLLTLGPVSTCDDGPYGVALFAMGFIDTAAKEHSGRNGIAASNTGNHSVVAWVSEHGVG